MSVNACGDCHFKTELNFFEKRAITDRKYVCARVKFGNFPLGFLVVLCVSARISLSADSRVCSYVLERRLVYAEWQSA